MFGREGDALGLAGFDRQRVQPERLPAVVEPVEQAEMVAVQAKDGGLSARLVTASTTTAPGFGAEGRLGVAASRRQPIHSGRSTQIDAERVLQVELRRQAVGGQRRWRRQRRRARGGSDDTIEKPMVRACLPSWRRILRFEPGGAFTSTKASTRLPGASTIAPLRARNGSDGWLSIAMTVTSTDSSFSAMMLRRLPLMKRSLKRSLDRASYVHRGFAVKCIEIRGFGRVGAWHDRGPVGPQPPFLHHEHLVAIDADGLVFRDHQRLASRRPRWNPPSRLMSHRKVPA